MQIPMFFDSYETAVAATVTALGGNKIVGNMLWPSMPADEAGRKLAHCLNPEKRDKLCINELALIRREARKKGVHILAHHEARDAGYAEPKPLNPESEHAQLQREYIAAVRNMQELTERMAHLGSLRIPE